MSGFAVFVLHPGFSIVTSLAHTVGDGVDCLDRPDIKIRYKYLTRGLSL